MYVVRLFPALCFLSCHFSQHTHTHKSLQEQKCHHRGCFLQVAHHLPYLLMLLVSHLSPSLLNRLYPCPLNLHLNFLQLFPPGPPSYLPSSPSVACKVLLSAAPHSPQGARRFLLVAPQMSPRLDPHWPHWPSAAVLRCLLMCCPLNFLLPVPPQLVSPGAKIFHPLEVYKCLITSHPMSVQLLQCPLCRPPLVNRAPHLASNKCPLDFLPVPPKSLLLGPPVQSRPPTLVLSPVHLQCLPANPTHLKSLPAISRFLAPLSCLPLDRPPLHCSPLYSR